MGQVIHSIGKSSDTTVTKPQGDGLSGALGADRRRSGQRARGRDRLLDRANQDYEPNVALTRVDQIENLLLFIDDDLRETALAIDNIEGYLLQTLQMLESRDLDRPMIVQLANEPEVMGHVDALTETLENLRRRLSRLAGKLS